MAGSDRWEKCSCADKAVDLYVTLDWSEKRLDASMSTLVLPKRLMLKDIQKVEEICGIDLSDVKELVEMGYAASERESYKKAAVAFSLAKAELRYKLSECAKTKF